MLDIRFIADNQEYVKSALKSRSGEYDIDTALKLYLRRKEVLVAVENMKATRNKVSQQISALKRSKQPCEDLIEQMQKVSEDIKALDTDLSEIETSLKDILLTIPNIPDQSVPLGKDESDNVQVRSWAAPTKFDFTPKPHWEIGEEANILDPAAGAKVTGARFTVYRGLGARLERALINFMLDSHTQNGYTEILPPFMVNRESMYGTGQLPKFEEDAFSVNGTNYFLVPTAEVPITNLFRGDILRAEQLPIKYCAYSACFRAEAGSAGRDTRGLIRQHQFNKVELVNFCRPEESMDNLESLTSSAESILQKLGLPYRVVLLCGGDLGFSSAKTYDIEVWMPSYNKYVEISSCSNCLDYQARRMNIRYKKDGRTALLHTLNGSGLAVGRTTAAILENFQNKDGSVTVPKALVPYMGVDIIKATN